MLDFGFYNMDCMEGMKQFPDKYFDLAVVDPPYGDALQSDEGGVESVRTEIRQVQDSTDNKRTAQSRTGCSVTRTGGTWASKYSKKLFRGTSRRNRNTLTNCFASHGIR